MTTSIYRIMSTKLLIFIKIFAIIMAEIRQADKPKTAEREASKMYILIDRKARKYIAVSPNIVAILDDMTDPNIQELIYKDTNGDIHHMWGCIL